MKINKQEAIVICNDVVIGGRRGITPVIGLTVEGGTRHGKTQRTLVDVLKWWKENRNISHAEAIRAVEIAFAEKGDCNE